MSRAHPDVHADSSGASGSFIAPGLGAWLLRQPKSVLEAMIRRLPAGRQAFQDTAGFPWISGLERDWRLIRRELDAVMATADIPAVEELSPIQRNVAGSNWRSYWFVVGGWWVDAHCRVCPETARLLRTVPGLQSCFFSVLEPNSRLKPHRGPYSGALRYHLALRVPDPPEACGIRVNGEVAHWTEGKSLIFDDSFVHDAWNETDEVRVILFVDVERPLPSPLRQLNRGLLKLIANAPFVRELRRNLADATRRQGGVAAKP